MKNNKDLALFFAGGLLAAFVLVFIVVPEWKQSPTEPHRTQDSEQKGRPLEKSIITSKKEKTDEEVSALFNDPAINQAWGLKKSDAARAWTVSKGDRKIVVAIIDTGIDENHEDLKANLWMNPGESGKDSLGRNKDSNGIDDDGNGYIDDVHGWNFVSNNNKLDDNHGHGSHIAGIIGAEGGNNKGIIGIAPEVSLMILKYYDPKIPGADNLKNTVKAIEYAVKMGASLINYSGGGTEYSKEEFAAVSDAQNKRILFIAAAGNERSNSDQFHYYPADYKLDNIISVTAIDPNTKILSSSNYGVETVDIAAPGQNILSTLPGNAYGYMTGTSQATAFVTGAAVLIMANKKNFDYQEVKKYIISTGDEQTQLATKTRNSRQLNLFKALTILDKNVSVSGLVTANGDNISVSLDPNEGNEDSTKAINQFGKSLLNVIGPTQPEKIGTDQNGKGL
ncbi:MAG: S8 family peptidase [Pseudobdellovibrionaceae bacterium]